MMFKVTYAYNVRRFIRRTVEADTPEAAVAIARDEAQQHISRDVAQIENSDDFGSVAGWNAFAMIDTEEGEVVNEISLAELDEQ